MKYKKYIKYFLSIGLLWVTILFIAGCSQQMDTDFSSERNTIKESKINDLNPSSKQKYKDLEKQKSHIDSQMDKYTNKRNQIIKRHHDNENSIPRRDTSFKNPVKAYVNGVRDALDGIKRDKKFRENLDDIDIKIDQAMHKRNSVQAKMDKILEESTKTCFPKNTKIVMFDGSLKEIDTIIEGDKVMIYDIANDVISESSVNKKFIDTNNHLYIINNHIKTTSYERFLTKDGWKRTHNISTKDSIFNGNSFVKVDNIYKIKKDLTVYNLNINSTHNFFVSFENSDEWFLIHNSSGGHGGSGSSGGGGK